jgi:hypothetical protein
VVFKIYEKITKLLTSPSDEINDNYYEDDINEVIFSSEKKKLAFQKK